MVVVVVMGTMVVLAVVVVGDDGGGGGSRSWLRASIYISLKSDEIFRRNFFFFFRPVPSSPAPFHRFVFHEQPVRHDVAVRPYRVSRENG